MNSANAVNEIKGYQNAILDKYNSCVVIYFAMTRYAFLNFSEQTGDNTLCQ